RRLPAHPAGHPGRRRRTIEQRQTEPGALDLGFHLRELLAKRGDPLRRAFEQEAITAHRAPQPGHPSGWLRRHLPTLGAPQLLRETEMAERLPVIGLDD